VTIAVLATWDTKRAEAGFLAAQIGEAVPVDLSIDRGDGGDKTAQMTAAAGRARAELAALAADGRIQGAVAIGGGTGTWLAARALDGLPLGFPKLLVSTVAGPIAAEATGGTDITVMSSITDIAGLNPILRAVLIRAGRAIEAMSRPVPASTAGRKPIAMTLFGVTGAGGEVARGTLAAAGWDVAVFHANGTGGRTLEALAARGEFSAVLDFSTTELIDELVGGRCSAGPHRLEAAGAAGLPQVVVPGAMDVVNLGVPDRLPPRFAGRIKHLHRPDSVLIRSDATENAEVARVMAAKLNAARGPVRVVVPAGGFSVLVRRPGRRPYVHRQPARGAARRHPPGDLPGRHQRSGLRRPVCPAPAGAARSERGKR
jgi:uncharacterized protein (UPF0261 family)